MARTKLLKPVLGVIIAFVAVFISLAMGAVMVSASQADYWASGQTVVESPEILSENSAHIIFSKEAKMSGMSYIEPNGAGRYDELYSEQVEFGGLPCRQVYAENKFYIKMDSDFADDSDRAFSISFDYWNYGGGGYIYLDYYPVGSNSVSTLSILKLGLDKDGNKTENCWYRVTVCIADAQLGNGKMEHGADFRIRSGAYNAFTRFEVENLSKGAGTRFLGVYNDLNYGLLQELGLFPAYGEGYDATEFFSRQLTREEALVMMIKGYAMEDEALKKKLSTTYTDVSAANEPYIGLAESMGIVPGGGILNTDEPFTQKEFIGMYLKLLSIDVPEGKSVYDVAIDKNLVLSENLIFQPEKIADVDTFAGLSMNALVISNEKTGYNAFTEGVNAGTFDVGSFIKSGNESVIEWMQHNTFKLPKKTYYDKVTGRTYYAVNFFGGDAGKSYYTMNCMANDNKRVYFKALEKYIVEYNIETEMCRYIDMYHGSGCMVTPLDNLWYVNTSLELIKMDLDTYEKTVMGKLPEWQNNAWTLQINNDESLFSCWFVTDGSGEIDNKKESRMPLYNIKTGEWDLRYKYGFDDCGQGNPNHMCINPNPKYGNLLFFAHEGSNVSSYTGKNTMIPDRTWLLNYDTGEFKNIIEQKWYMTPNSSDIGTGIMGEGGCHEAWSYDGEWIFNVTGTTWSNSFAWKIHDPDAMIAMVRWDGTDKRLITLDYDLTRSQIAAGSNINHAMVSFDNRWIAADCQYNSMYRSDLYIGDIETGESQLVAITSQKGVDPGHTHPQFSPNGKYILFGQWSEDLTCSEFAWVDVSDITSNPSPGSKVQISESCDALSYDCDMEHSITTVFNENGDFEYAKVPRDHYMYVDVKKEIIESDNTPGQITITYKDDTKLPIKLVYYTWNENAATRDMNVLKENEIYINRKGTGGVVTKTFKFDDICFGNMHILGSDFKIGAIGAEATILSVEVKAES